MNESIESATPTGAVHTHHLPVPADLRPLVSALIGVEMGPTGPMPLAIAPHDAMLLTVQFARHGVGSVEAKSELGANTRITGIRHWTGSFTGAGDCVTLFALLTPLGSVQLLNSRRLGDSPRIRAPLAELLDARFTRALESRIALAGGLPDQLQTFAAWLEERVKERGRQERAALRAARAAMRLCAEPLVAMDRLADEQHVSRRQIERDFTRWLGVSPRHLSQVARVQGVARHAHAGASLASAAAEMGFADQSHMNRVVRQLTGLTPREFVRSRPSAMSALSAAFRAATGGGKVYL
jgi:AraC-like DNA-binding protein